MKVTIIVDHVKKNYLVLILALLIIIIYVRYHLAVNPKLEIIQTHIDKLAVSHLFEKSPIIIQDRMVTPLSLLDTLFKYLYVKKRMYILRNKLFNPYVQNTHKYTILYASTNIDVQIIHPNEYNSGKPSNVVTIPIQSHQVLILPMFWWYSVKGTAFLIELDSFSSLVSSMFTS